MQQSSHHPVGFQRLFSTYLPWVSTLIVNWATPPARAAGWRSRIEATDQFADTLSRAEGADRPGVREVVGSQDYAACIAGPAGIDRGGRPQENLVHVSIL
jgi:hypothetical protein